MPGKHDRGFAGGRTQPPDRRCSAIVKDGPNAGQRCPNWTIRAPEGATETFLPLCAAHAGVPQKAWQRMSEEAKADRARAMDAARKREARAREKSERIVAEVEAKEEAEREKHRLRQLELERQRLAKLAEEKARYTPPDFPRLLPGELWFKQRVEPAKAQHVDDVGPFRWAITTSLQNIRREVDAILVDGFRQRDKLMEAQRRPTRDQLIHVLNARRHKREREDPLRSL